MGVSPFFYDDCLVFMKADSRSAHRLNEILQACSLGSGQGAKKLKSLVFFSPKCGASIRVGGPECLADPKGGPRREVPWFANGGREDYKATI